MNICVDRYDYIKDLKEKLLNLGLDLGSFANGGFTANIGIDKPAGLVHGGEWVASASFVNQNRGLIEALEKRQRGFKNGGFVNPINNTSYNYKNSNDKNSETNKILKEVLTELKKKDKIIIELETDVIKLKKAIDREIRYAS